MAPSPLFLARWGRPLDARCATTKRYREHGKDEPVISLPQPRDRKERRIVGGRAGFEQVDVDGVEES